MTPIRPSLALFALLVELLLGAFGAAPASAQCANGSTCNDNNVCTTDS